MRNKLIKDYFIRLFSSMGVDIGARTPLKHLRDLIYSLHPMDSDNSLIRLGPDGDGGYLLPDDLEGIKYGFSPGVSDESGFEMALAERGIEEFLADYSVDSPAEFHERFHFDKKFIGAHSDEKFMTMDQWKSCRIPDYDDDLIMQMDIEGAEFEALLSISPELLSQFRIMIIEFHYLQELFHERFFILLSRVFQKLLQSHSVAHIHPNNCCGSIKGGGLEIPRVAEFTFYRNDRFERKSFAQNFPHTLDRDNTKKTTLVLPSCWYQQ